MSILKSAGIIGLTTQFLAVSLLVLHNFYRHDSVVTNEEQLYGVYDYIVVGTGSSGSVVAARLAEDGRTKVLAIEAGPPSGLPTDIPAQVATAAHYRTQYDWNVTLAPQSVGRAFLKGVIPETKGHVVGGSSSINTMIFNRGNSRGYDSWARDFGAVGWSYAEVMPYFLRYEGNRDPIIVNQNPGYHSTKGPVGITTWQTPDPLIVLHEKIINHEAGIPSTDINGPVQLGTQIAQATIDVNGVRSSSSNSYIDPNPFPHNLHILPNSLVTRILFNGNKAVGVLLERNGIGYKVMARKEVILSAGVDSSPKLLMLSGIGPAQHLQEMHIPVLQDLPVGLNLQNHPSLLFWFVIRPESLKLTNIPGALTIPQLYQWFTTGTGPLAAHYRAVTYMSTSTNPDKDWPNVNWETTIYPFPQNLTDYTQFQFQDVHAWNKHLSNYLGRMYLSVHTVVQRPRSSGYVRLISKNPHAPTIIQPNYLKDPLDYIDKVEMVKEILRFYELSSISQHLEPLIPIPGCKLCPGKYVFECEPYIHCVIEQVLFSGYHGVGTCRMGDPKRPDVVVDPYLRVKGISGLRVCDLSIAPLIPNANTNSAALMIGEKCAQMIKDQSKNV